MRFMGILGLVVLLGLAWLMSNNKKKIKPRIILWGVGLQLLFAMIILSKNQLSQVGMFIFLGLILVYIFTERIEVAGSALNKAGMITGIIAAAALVSLVGYFLQGTHLDIVLLLLALALAFWAGWVRKADLGKVFTSLFLMIGFGMICARGILGLHVFKLLSEKVDAFLKLTDLGTAFLFANLVNPAYFDTFGFQFAFAVLPTIIFFGAFMSLLYYLGIIQVVVQEMARFMRWTMGTSGAESLSCSANVFVGQTEAPLLIKPFLANMTKSELTTIMVGGFATIAGGVLAGLIRIGVNPGHLIAASVMSAPAALVIGKIIFPETEHSETAGDVVIKTQKTAGNMLEAVSAGISDGLKLAVNVGAMLIGFIALIGLVDVILNSLDMLIDGKLLGGAYFEVKKSIFSPVVGEYAGFFPGSLKTFFGSTFRYLAFLMGTPWQDTIEMGNLLGLKVTVNEFVAYSSLAEHIKNATMSPKAIIIGTYALCGFANFSSIGIQIGGIGALAPERRGDLAKVGLKAMFGGALASWMTATIAGMLIGG